MTQRAEREERLTGEAVVADLLATMRRLVRLLVVATTILACAGDDAPYRVDVDLEPSIRALASDDLDESSPAGDRLIALGVVALPALDAALRREDDATRIAVIEVLAEMPGDGPIPLLVRVLRDDASSSVRAEAAFALRGMHGKQAVEDAVVVALGDDAPEVRQNAAVACGSLCQGTTCIERLTGLALGDDAQSVWWSARVALARLRREGGKGQAVDASVRTAAPAPLAGNDAERADRAAFLLADAGDARGAGRLEDLVQTAGDVTTRQQAVTALGEVGGPTAIASLCAARRERSLALLATAALQRATARGVDGAREALETCAGPPA